MAVNDSHGQAQLSLQGNFGKGGYWYISSHQSNRLDKNKKVIISPEI